MNWLNEENLGTAPDNSSMGDINDITASTQEKTGSDTEQFRKIYGTYHKNVATDPVLHSSLPTKYILHTHYYLPKYKCNGNAHYSLEDSATEPFQPHWRSDKNKQSNAQWHAQQWQQDRWQINLKGKNEVKSGTNEKQY